MNLTMAEAKKLFEFGHFEGFYLADDGMGGGWWLNLESKSGLMTLVDARTKRARVFKTLDAAINAARQIGFKATVLKMEGC